jgi:serine/threonine protein kinase
MTWLPDSTIFHLRDVADWPDLADTRYEVLEKLGAGGTASVYLARDRELQREVAIKVLHDTGSDPLGQDRMLAEARIVARLEHPGILPIHDLGRLPDGRIYYVMKRVRGCRLGDFIKTGPSLTERLRVFFQINEAVAFAHSQGVIHRDLKPDNVMIGDFGEVLVIDWGVDVAGTPGYRAPEQADGRAARVDERTDVHGMGGLLSLMFPLIERPPRPLVEICKKAQSADPENRYPSAAALGQDVSRFVEGGRVSAFRETVWETGLRLFRRHRIFVLLVATYLIVRIILVFFVSAR